jgi:hypothetical protein
MARTLVGALRQDANRRRERAERKKSDLPPEQIAAHNGCIMALGGLELPTALLVVRRIEKGIVEELVTRARG